MYSNIEAELDEYFFAVESVQNFDLLAAWEGAESYARSRVQNSPLHKILEPQT